MGFYRLIDVMTPNRTKPTIRLGAAATAGRSHIRHGKGCEDAVAVQRLRRNAHTSSSGAYIALADGAGSAPAGFEGASLLVKLIGRLIHDNRATVMDGDDRAREFLYSGLHAALSSEALRVGRPMCELASTLLFAYLDRGDGRYIVGHVGDGVVALGQNGCCMVLSPPDKGEFANETIFFTSRSALARLRLYTGNATSNLGFMLMSDGAADSLYGKRNGALAPACGQILQWFEDCPEKVASEALARNINETIINKTHDDCSIAVMQVSGGKPRDPNSPQETDA